MDLQPEQQELVVATALSYLGQSYGKEFRCVDFVREVYKVLGIKIPRLSTQPVPQWINIHSEDVSDPPAGHLIFLRRKETGAARHWTHVVIALPERQCVHCSHFFGRKVTISPLEDILALYDFAPSGPV
jgi:cell wall-associated NlpC family hydrolase